MTLPAARITHRHIEVFRAVMTTGSATGAATLLASSQPTVSRELARLEQLLGYALFARSQGRLRPNARALALWDEVQRSWQGLERVVDKALALGRAEEAQISVLCLPALSHALLPGAAARLLTQYPQARLAVTPQESPLLEEWMAAQRFDLGLSEHDAAPAGCQALPLLTMDEVCVLPAGHPLAARSVLRVEDFADQPFASLSLDDPYRRQIDAVFAQAGVARQMRVQTHNAVAVCAMVQQGLGLAIVNPLTALACAGPQLLWRPLAFSIPFRVQALLPLHRPALPEVQPLLQALRDEAAMLAGRLARAA
ncbi:LysR family transcriptional regulator [Acidovorax sp. Be4]|uniref:LysR family transcriptional regulator n=1 Tax=Acidovorax bellezanensis TaxID=2976702 RepID=A0ABT2PLH8_9BURK|nr:LysR family transcriptional regulator [Acidovorax sp. Be4]MCT9810082.1 LysR family transcriptional regulator [Acidovorax sp. Be4]